MVKTSYEEAWDEEWLLLIAKAKEMGLTVEEVKSFLKQPQNQT